MSRLTNTNTLVSNIVNFRPTQDLLHAHGLKAHSITWEDTGRCKGSCWGPNISDMTLTVKDGHKLMPVIRKPNFSDVTSDIPIDTFKLHVGNEKGGASHKIITLKEYLENISDYLPDSHAELKS